MKIHYFNDEHKDVLVQVNHKLQHSVHNPFGEPKVEYFTLVPQQSKTFEIDAPAGAIPYIKRWENRMVLITYLPQQQDQDKQSHPSES